MYEARGRVPHFVVHTTDNTTVDYGAIWQKQQLLLVCLDDSDASAAVAAVAEELVRRRAELMAAESCLVVTRDVVPGADRPGVVVADRWGEIHASLGASAIEDADDLIEWMRFVRRKCS